MATPRATILVPTHGHRPTLRYALASARAQTVPDFELVVVGDGAAASTREILAEVQAEDPRVAFVEHPKGPRFGEVYRDPVLRQARGAVVCYLSDDDLWLPDHLATMLQLLAGADFAHSLPLWVDEAGRIQVYTVDLALPFHRDLLRVGENRVPLNQSGHTLDLYRRLPEGWRTTPQGLPTDLYMWQQILAMPGVRVASGTRPTVVHLPTSCRGERDMAARLEEIQTWWARVQDPTWRGQLAAEVLTSVVRDRARQEARLVGERRQAAGERPEGRPAPPGLSRPPPLDGAVDRTLLLPHARQLEVMGWAACPVAGRPAEVVDVLLGDQVLASVRPCQEREDVAAHLGDPARLRSGFRVALPLDRLPSPFEVCLELRARAGGRETPLPWATPSAFGPLPFRPAPGPSWDRATVDPALRLRVHELAGEAPGRSRRTGVLEGWPPERGVALVLAVDEGQVVAAGPAVPLDGTLRFRLDHPTWDLAGARLYVAAADRPGLRLVPRVEPSAPREEPVAAVRPWSHPAPPGRLEAVTVTGGGRRASGWAGDPVTGTLPDLLVLAAGDRVLSHGWVGEPRPATAPSPEQAPELAWCGFSIEVRAAVDPASLAVDALWRSGRRVRLPRP